MTLFEHAERERRQQALGRATERQSTRRDTSDDACDGPMTEMRSVILGLFRERARTADEVIGLGYTHQSASATINWLMRHGHIVDSGERRRTQSGRNAIVWSWCDEPRPIMRERPTRRELERRITAALQVIDRNHADLTYLRRVLTGEATP